MVLLGFLTRLVYSSLCPVTIDPEDSTSICALACLITVRLISLERKQSIKLTLPVRNMAPALRISGYLLRPKQTYVEFSPQIIHTQVINVSTSSLVYVNALLASLNARGNLRQDNVKSSMMMPSALATRSIAFNDLDIIEIGFDTTAMRKTFDGA